MANNVPTAGFVLSLIGGIFVLLAGIVLAVIGSFLASFIGGIAGIFFVGLVVGLLIIVLSVMLYVRPQMKTIWGILIIILAIVSLPTALGGFFIGFLLALIGGVLAITYKAPQAPPMVAPPMMAPPMGAPMGSGPVPANCPSCGAPMNPASRTCTSCVRSV